MGCCLGEVFAQKCSLGSLRSELDQIRKLVENEKAAGFCFCKLGLGSYDFDNFIYVICSLCLSTK